MLKTASMPGVALVARCIKCPLAANRGNALSRAANVRIPSLVKDAALRPVKAAVHALRIIL